MLVAIAGDLHGALDLLYERLARFEARSGRKAALVLQCANRRSSNVWPNRHEPGGSGQGR